MKIALIQADGPERLLALLGGLEGVELAVLPEYANLPSERFGAPEDGAAFLEKTRAIARAKRMRVCVPIVRRAPRGYRNMTYLLNGAGEVAAEYAKAHLSANERALGFEAGSEAVVAECDGARYGFMCCLDAYFPSFAERLAELSPDVVLFPSSQRAEERGVIEAQAAGRALDMEALVLRCARRFSLAADCRGRVIAGAGEGEATVIFEATPEKRARPLAYGRPERFSRDIVRECAHRIAYAPRCGYRARPEGRPLIVAHRGLSRESCPENTLPAFGAAAALGVDEIEMDVWGTLDGELVVCHDPSLARVTGSERRLCECRWRDIRGLSASLDAPGDWAGTRLTRLGEVFAALGGRVGFNIHIKNAPNLAEVVEETARLIREYGLTYDAYFAGDERMLPLAAAKAPEIVRCSLSSERYGTGAGGIVDRALEFGCQRLQFCMKYTPEDAQRANREHILCNLFFRDEPEEAMADYKNGIGAILTNRAHRFSAWFDEK